MAMLDSLPPEPGAFLAGSALRATGAAAEGGGATAPAPKESSLSISPASLSATGSRPGSAPPACPPPPRAEGVAPVHLPGLALGHGLWPRRRPGRVLAHLPLIPLHPGARALLRLLPRAEVRGHLELGLPPAHE